MHDAALEDDDLLPLSSSREPTGGESRRAKMAWLTMLWGGEKSTVLVRASENDIPWRISTRPAWRASRISFQPPIRNSTLNPMTSAMALVRSTLNPAALPFRSRNS